MGTLPGGGNELKDVLDDVTRWPEGGEWVAVATVVGVKRSAPRAPGDGGRLVHKGGGRIHEVGA